MRERDKIDDDDVLAEYIIIIQALGLVWIRRPELERIRKKFFGTRVYVKYTYLVFPDWLRIIKAFDEKGMKNVCIKS